MKKKRKSDEVSASQYMALAENAKTINTFATTGPAGQQFFLYKFIASDSVEDEQRRIEELTK